MKLSDFDFDLPEELIATRPAQPRSSARLLLAQGDAIADHIVRELPDFLQPGDLLVLNDTQVIPARLSGLRHRSGAQGDTAAAMEVTLLEPRADGTWAALVKPLKKLREGERIDFAPDFHATLWRGMTGRRICGSTDRRGIRCRAERRGGHAAAALYRRAPRRGCP